MPYVIEKVNMNCYGDKPAWFWAMQPSGGIPVAKIDGQVIRESNDIVMALERAFPEQPLLPNPANDPEGHARVQPLLSLERELFSMWFRWLTSSANQGASLIAFRSLLDRVEAELGVASGPFFLGGQLSLVDIFFAPFLERMVRAWPLTPPPAPPRALLSDHTAASSQAASLPYYKGLRVRDPEAYPRIEAWFKAMEARPSYRHIQSDFYTHVHDLPPQIGGCRGVPEAAPYADLIDGSGASWTLGGLEALHSLQPVDGLGQSSDAARREAAERLLANHKDVAGFAARGLGKPGVPPVSARLSDPRATSEASAVPLVDASLRHVVHALLSGTDAAAEKLSDDLDAGAVTATLGYLRDRISVPRDMGYPAAIQLRAHLNWLIEEAGAREAHAKGGA